VARKCAFDCGSSAHQILLSHNQFEGAIGHCNGDGIVARSIDAVPASNGTDDQIECFISQLRVAITDAMRNKTVECIHDQPHLPPTVIGMQHHPDFHNRYSCIVL
jgi:hypothetical protein